MNPTKNGPSPRPIIEPVKLNRKAVFGFAMFDFANSAFTTVIVTAYFSIWFQSILVPPILLETGEKSTGHGTFLWGVANSVSQIIVILTAPILGALADFSGAKKRFLFVTYIGCCLLTISLGWVHPGQVALGFSLFVIANVFYSSGENFVGALLPEVAPPEKMGLISGISWGLGYIGGIGSLVAALLILAVMGPEAGYPWVWIMTGVWFLAAGIPAFMFVTERRHIEPMPPGQNMVTIGFHRLYQTYQDASRYRQLFRFLLIFILIYAGLQAAVTYAGIVADQTLHFTTTELGIFLMVCNVAGVFGAFFWGWLGDRIGNRNAIISSLAAWLIALVLVALIPAVPAGESASRNSRILFWIAGTFVGIGMGSTSSSCRALVGMFSPTERSGEFFGLWAFFGKLGTVIGPFSFGLITKHYSLKVAMAAMTVYFLTASILMFTVNEAEGKEAARSPINV